MNKILSIIYTASVVIALGVLAYLGFSFYDTYKTQVRNEALYQCATSSKYEVASGDTTVSYPVADLYEECLEEKGIN